jgi:predicted transcriptional regulator
MTQKEIANEIMNEFARTNSKPNHVIQQRWFTQVLARKLNPKEQELVNPAIQDLINSGLATSEDRHGWCLVLTEQGFDEIYPINETETVNKIAQKILNRFAETNSRVNHTVDFKWINFNLLKDLNPKEAALVDAAIQKLVTDGLITTEDRHGWCMVLTQQGFDTIY